MKEFNQTFLDLWPEFDLALRAVNTKPEERKIDFEKFKILP
jgi:hypothetical protein